MGWISVKDKLPEIGQEVLIWHCAEHEPLSKGSIELATYEPGQDLLGEKYAWSASEYDLPLEDVTHWAELPAPPSG